MSLLAPSTSNQLDTGRHMVLWHIGWTGFQKILEIMPGRRLRAAYSHGDLEIMSPLPLHETLKIFFGYLLMVVAEEFDLVMRCLGSTTFRRSDFDRGIEPDQSFYFTSFNLIADWTDIDLKRDPPPDLAIEVEITSSILNRVEIYQALKVPELWRCDEENLHVWRLDSQGQYQPVPASGVLPFLPMNEILPLFHSLKNSASDTDILRSLRTWARERVAPLYNALPKNDS